MSGQLPSKDILQPLYPIPIIATPQPQAQTFHKVNQLQPKDELEIYKRQYNRLLKENNLLLSHLAKITQEKDALQAKYNNIQVVLLLFRFNANLKTKEEKECEELPSKQLENLIATFKNVVKAMALKLHWCST